MDLKERLGNVRREKEAVEQSLMGYDYQGKPQSDHWVRWDQTITTPAIKD